MKNIPFTDKIYKINKEGRVWSEFSFDYITGKSISSTNKRLTIDVRVDGVKKSLLIHRLVYFVYKYAPKLNKSVITFKDFKEMPLIYHKNGNITDNYLYNLQLVKTREELGKKTSKQGTTRRVSTITGKDAERTIEWIKKGKTRKFISSMIDKSTMSVYRFAKANNLLK